MSREQPKGRRYRLRAASLGDVRSAVDLDKTVALADSIETKIIRKMELRK